MLNQKKQEKRFDNIKHMLQQLIDRKSSFRSSSKSSNKLFLSAFLSSILASDNQIMLNNKFRLKEIDFLNSHLSKVSHDKSDFVIIDQNMHYRDV